MPVTIRTYCLPTSAADVPLGIRNTYRVDGFDKSVRDWHLARLPKYTVPTIFMILCPYCGKYKDPRSMQIDHIIPIRTYMRYRLYNMKFVQDERDATGMTTMISSDHNNLLMSCMKCNTGAGQAVIDNTRYLELIATVRAIDKKSKLLARLESNRQTREAIHALSRAEGYNLSRFYRTGVDWSTTSRTLRQHPKAPISALIVDLEYATACRLRLLGC